MTGFKTCRVLHQLLEWMAALLLHWMPLLPSESHWRPVAVAALLMQLQNPLLLLQVLCVAR